ncbi:MAG: hypothetical protein ABJM43_19905 [Paracoccaceae bacterium]
MRVKTVGQALTKGFSQFRPLITNTHGNLDLVGTSTWELAVNQHPYGQRASSCQHRATPLLRVNILASQKINVHRLDAQFLPPIELGGPNFGQNPTIGIFPRYVPLFPPDLLVSSNQYFSGFFSILHRSVFECIPRTIQRGDVLEAA